MGPRREDTPGNGPALYVDLIAWKHTTGRMQPLPGREIDQLLLGGLQEPSVGAARRSAAGNQRPRPRDVEVEKIQIPGVQLSAGLTTRPKNAGRQLAQ